MKKVLLLASVAVLALSSCKKERTCTCGSGDSAYKYTIESSASKGKAVCEGKGVTIKVDGEESDDDTKCTLD